jgi:tRNA pseudouridine38-40 synthase
VAHTNYNRPTSFPLEPGSRRIRLDVSYDGALFSGWQTQKGVRTVQHEIEKALAKIIKEKVHVQGSGRTDAKVHALGQVAHFDTTNHSVPAQVFALALNQNLAKDIRIISSSEVSEQFHARFTSTSREYHYYVKEIKDITPFDRHRVGVVRRFPSLELLNSYAQILLGIHDFTTFASAHDQSHSKVRDIFTSEFSLTYDQWEKPLLIYKVCANAFLMHQVRSMVGTMLQLGHNNEKSSELQRRLESRRREEAGRTAEAQGLYLYRISYE